QIAKGFPSSMSPGIGTDLGTRKMEAMVQFIIHLDEVAPDGNLIEVNRQDIVVEEAEAEEAE
ncbi:MAG: hypothetical protein ACE10B_00980, partial [Phycisphaerales bacterium]